MWFGVVFLQVEFNRFTIQVYSRVKFASSSQILIGYCILVKESQRVVVLFALFIEGVVRYAKERAIGHAASRIMRLLPYFLVP